MMGSGEVPDAQCARRDDEEPMIRREQAVEQQLQEGEDSINDHVKLEEIYVPELLQEPDGPECISGNHLREGNGSDRFEKYEQHAGRERVVRLIEGTLADPRVTADDTAQTPPQTSISLCAIQTNRTERRGCAEPKKQRRL